MEKLYAIFNKKQPVIDTTELICNYELQIQELKTQLVMQAENIDSLNKKVLYGCSVTTTITDQLILCNTSRDKYRMCTYILGLMNMATLVLLVANVVINNC